jgi:NAD(P)-dependent dehydrogenase (short-subunit alcohol dehydrogenase family)
MQLRDMTAIVTGAGRGMGRAFAEELASRGATVAICDVNRDDLEKTAAEIRSAHKVKVIAEAVDVSAEEQVTRFVARVEKECGRVDVLVNNAGIHPLHMIEDVTVEEWDKVLAVNVRSVFLFCRAVLPGMRKRRFGRIISVASEAGKNGGTIAAPHYCASKGAILAFTRNLARAVGADGVTVNALAPGRIATAMAGQVSAEANQVYIDKSAVKRLGKPEDVAWAVAFLADERSSFVTGETLNVNGGTLMD